MGYNTSYSAPPHPLYSSLLSLVATILLEEGKEERRIPLPEETARHPDCCRVFRRAGSKVNGYSHARRFSRPSTCRAGFSGCIPTLCRALSPLHYVWPGCVQPSLPNVAKIGDENDKTKSYYVKMILTKSMKIHYNKSKIKVLGLLLSKIMGIVLACIKYYS